MRDFAYWLIAIVVLALMVGTAQYSEALSISVEEASVRDLYFACLVAGQENPNLDKAWKDSGRMMAIRAGRK